jgi:hypothetical protein
MRNLSPQEAETQRGTSTLVANEAPRTFALISHSDVFPMFQCNKCLTP